MLKFQVFDGGKAVRDLPIRNASMHGSDGNAIRSEIWFDPDTGVLNCRKRELGAAALSLQRKVGDCGEMTLQTCLLPDREEPYILHVELARHRLLLIYTKLEEWAMFDIDPEHPFVRRLERAKNLFIEALCHVGSNAATADKAALESLIAAVDGSEELALAHAEWMLTKRRDAGTLPRHPIGSSIPFDAGSDRLRAALANNFDFICLPCPWKQIAPAEHEYRWDKCDVWADWAGRTGLPVNYGPLVSFDPQTLPDWAYVFEHDYDTIRDVVYEHVERVVSRYRHLVTAWTVVSGLHVNNHFTFAFDQLLDLTRMVIMLVKKLHPAGRTIVEISQPFGEYFAQNPRSIPPMMYADLLVQGAMEVDCFSLHLLMGQAQPGQYTRDLMQISALIDQFSAYGKPLQIRAAAPSEPVTEMMIASSDPSQPVDANSGYWRKPWNQLVQSHWVGTVSQIALSKPYVEAFVWDGLVDHPGAVLPLSGLVTEDLQPKRSFARLVQFRRQLLGLPTPSRSPDAKVGGSPSGHPATPPRR